MKNIARDKEGHFIIIIIIMMRPVDQEAKTILNVYVLSNGLKMRETKTELQGETDRSKLRDFSTSPSITARAK